MLATSPNFKQNARNALAASTMEELDGQLAALETREDVHCAVITGTGESFFKIARPLLVWTVDSASFITCTSLPSSQ